MNNYLDASRDLIADNTFERIGSLTGKSPRTWPTAGAVTGLAGCILAPALGATLTVISWLISQQRASFYLSRLSTTLFFLTIPLLALGAHCLDLLEARAATPSQSTATPFARIAPLGAGGLRGRPPSGAVVVGLAPAGAARQPRAPYAKRERAELSPPLQSTSRPHSTANGHSEEEPSPLELFYTCL